MLYQILAYITNEKTKKAHTIKINFKYLHQHGKMNLNYHMDLIPYQIFKITLNIFQKNKVGESVDKPSVWIYVNKTENRFTFTIKTWYSLERFTPETMKLLGSIKNKTTKDKNGENVPHLEITEVILLVYCNIVNNNYQKGSRVLYTFVPNKPFRSLLEISPTSHIFLKTKLKYGSLSSIRNGR